MNTEEKEGIEDYVVRTIDGKLMPDFFVRYLWRINNDGQSLVKCDERPHSFYKEIIVSRLSITYDTWIARDRMSTYIAKLIPKPKDPNRAPTWGIRDFDEKFEIAKANQTWHCRFHPTESFHEVGCPHIEWTAEQLQKALADATAMHRVYQHELWKLPLDGKPRTSYTS